MCLGHWFVNYAACHFNLMQGVSYLSVSVAEQFWGSCQTITLYFGPIVSLEQTVIIYTLNIGKVYLLNIVFACICFLRFHFVTLLNSLMNHLFQIYMRT